VVLGKSNLILVNYLIDQGADVYIPVTKRLLLFTGKFEKKKQCFVHSLTLTVNLPVLIADWIASVSTKIYAPFNGS